MFLKFGAMISKCLRFFKISPRVLETLEPFLDVQGLGKISNISEFPDDITLNQTVAAWKHIAAFKNKHAKLEL